MIFYDENSLEEKLAEEQLDNPAPASVSTYYVQSDNTEAINIIQDNDDNIHCDKIEEILIAEVKNRREIWDYKLPVSKRSRDVIALHWEQISKKLDGILTPTAACKKWRYLKDSYMRIRNNALKQASGSAASKPIKWKWYDHLQFLHDTQNPRSTTSNINNTYDKESSESSELEKEIDFKPKRYKRDNNDTWEKLATIMKEPIKIETVSSDNLQPKDVPKVEPVHDNIKHVIAIIENLLCQMGEEGLLFGLNLLQLTTARAKELRKK